jgi:hypothetical protein
LSINFQQVAGETFRYEPGNLVAQCDLLGDLIQPLSVMVADEKIFSGDYVQGVPLTQDGWRAGLYATKVLFLPTGVALVAAARKKVRELSTRQNPFPGEAS